MSAESILNNWLSPITNSLEPIGNLTSTIQTLHDDITKAFQNTIVDLLSGPNAPEGQMALTMGIAAEAFIMHEQLHSATDGPWRAVVSACDTAYATLEQTVQIAGLHLPNGQAAEAMTLFQTADQIVQSGDNPATDITGSILLALENFLSLQEVSSIQSTGAIMANELHSAYQVWKTAVDNATSLITPPLQNPQQTVIMQATPNQTATNAKMQATAALFVLLFLKILIDGFALHNTPAVINDILTGIVDTLSEAGMFNLLSDADTIAELIKDTNASKGGFQVWLGNDGRDFFEGISSKLDYPISLVAFGISVADFVNPNDTSTREKIVDTLNAASSAMQIFSKFLKKKNPKLSTALSNMAIYLTLMGAAISINLDLSPSQAGDPNNKHKKSAGGGSGGPPPVQPILPPTFDGGGTPPQQPTPKWPGIPTPNGPTGIPWPELPGPVLP